MADSRLAFDIIARGGNSAAAEFEKVAAGADRAGAAMKKNGAISAAVAKASANLTKVRNAETDALDKVQVAESKLSDARQAAQAKVAQVKTAERDLLTVRNDTRSTTSQIAAAESKLQNARNSSNSSTSKVLAGEKALSKARREAAVAGNVAQKAAKDLGKVLDDEGKKAGKGLGKSVLHWFTGAGKDFEKAGRKAGEAGGNGILSALSGTLKTPVIGPIIAVGLIAAVEAVAVPAGALLATGLVAGFGAGIGALGIVFAAKTVAVKNAWNRTLWSMAADMRIISKPFESTLVQMAAVAKETFATFKPQLSAAFKGLAPALTDFGDSLGRALGKLAPAIVPLSSAFERVLKSLGPAMESALANVSGGLQEIAASVSKSPDALADMVRGVGALTHDLLSMIKVLNDANGSFKRLTGVSGVTALFDGLRGAVYMTVGPFILLAAAVGKAADLLNALKHSADASGESMRQAGLAVNANIVAYRAAHGATQNLGASLARSAHETHAANAAALLLAGAYDRQTAATQRSIDALNRRSNLLLALSGAEIGYQQAVDDATAAVKANGKTHDINTQKGRDNKTALLQVASAAIAQRDAMLKANDGNVKAAKSAEGSRANFVKLAVQMGYSIPVAKRMAAQMIAIPNVTREAKLKANKADLDAKLAAAKKQLADPNLTATKKAKLQAEIAQLLAAVNAAQAKINSLHGKTVTNSVVTKYSSTGVNLTAPSSVGRRASGGPVSKGMPYVVGEHRPELFVPKQDGTIIPRLPRKTSGSAFGGSAQPMAIRLEVAAGNSSAYTAFLISELRKYVRINGGDVQAVLGRG